MMLGNGIEEFTKRILSVEKEDKAQFGRLNAAQMICHCTDQLRMLFGEIKGLKRQDVDLKKLREMMMRKETVPTVEGLDQLAGDGTKPIDFSKDKDTLLEYLNRFKNCDDECQFHFHPYLGDISAEYWEKLVIQHLDHHLNQFGR
ncbi:MAG: DUF1569 domain-containing protein [Ignavibacteria bacterium]|jgi:hypothetical protein